MPFTERERFILTNEKFENELGKIISQRIQGSAPILPKEHEIGNRLLSVCGKQRYSIPWEFHVIDLPINNAFSTFGGKIFIFSGLIQGLKNADELAGVLSHEIAHVLARHHAEKLSNLYWLNKYSKTMEHEADEIGLILLSRACFKPSGMKKGFERLHQFIPNQNSYLSTHPTKEDRMKELQRLTEIGYQQRREYCSSQPPKIENWYSNFPKK